MSAPDLVEYFNETRERIANASTPQAVENDNVIPLQANIRDSKKAA